MIIRQKNSVIDRALYEKDEILFSDQKEREVLKVILQKKGKLRSKKELKYNLIIKKLEGMKNVLVVREKNINIAVDRFNLKNWIIGPLKQSLSLSSSAL